jgi:hypothetical protein
LIIAKKNGKKTKKMDNKTILIIAALGAAYFLMNGTATEQRYFVPNRGYVPESQLPGLGYVKINGQWYSQAQVDAAAAQAGVSGGNVSQGSTAWNTIAAILASASSLLTTLGNQQNSGGGGMAGVYGYSQADCNDAGYRLKTNHSATAGSVLAHCKWQKQKKLKKA